MYVYTRGEQDGVPGGKKQDGISGEEQDDVPGGHYWQTLFDSSKRADVFCQR